MKIHQCKNDEDLECLSSFTPATIIRSIFLKYDTDYDGYISTSELVKLCYEDIGLDKDRSEACAYLLDRKGNKLVSFDELNDWIKVGEHLTNIQDNSKFLPLKAAVDMFRKYDTDSSHAIDRKEFKKLFLDVGGKPSDMDNALQQLDKDGNKKISFEEFLFWLNWVTLEDFL